MTDSIVDQSGEIAPELFPGVFVPLGKWLRPKPEEFCWTFNITPLTGLHCEANHIEYVSNRDPTGPIVQGSRLGAGGRKIPEAGVTAASVAIASGRESEGQKARAEQHKAGCGEGEEALGNEVMMMHVTSSFSEARRN